MQSTSDKAPRRPKVSIVTATYNSEATLRDTIESVLAQDYRNVELIIVDGNSQDHTLDIVRSYGTAVSRCVSEPDKGIYDAMNKGIQLATGDIIGILNSDDFFATPRALSLIVEQFEAHPELDAVYGDLYYVDSQQTDKVVRYWRNKPYHPKAFYHGWHPAHPTFYVRREVYEKYGTFDLRFPLSADFELMLRLFECCRIQTRHIDAVLVKMRTGGATSRNVRAILRGIGQCKRAFRVNGLRPPLLYPLYRLLPKLKQFTSLPPFVSKK